MGQKLNLNEKSCVNLSPNSVLPSHQNCLNVKKEKAYRNGKFKEYFSDINSSFTCKSHKIEGNTEKRRRSIYQSSNQVIGIRKMATILEERKKVEISRRTSDASFSSSIFHSLCGSDDEDSIETSSLISHDSELSSQAPSVSGSYACMDHNITSSFIELCINSDVCDENFSVVEGVVGSVNSKIRSDKFTNPPLQKVKISHSHQPYPSESDCSSRVSSQVPFTPIRKRLNPFTKSKKVARNMACQKSLLNDFSNTTKVAADIVSDFYYKRDVKYSGLACSPVHLHGNLKLKNKQGLPYFEFKVNSPEDVFVAKTWKVGSTFNWVYTFHSFDNRKKNNAGSLGSQHCEKDSSMIAQMLVSYSLCSELEDGVFGNYMVTKFVLYDFTHSRKSDITRNTSSLESAAIVLRIPSYKRESLKCKRGDRINAKAYSKPSDITSPVEQVKVVLPIGNHGLPSGKSEGPSSLLDRWKHGGGCDCGGWDMACPLILLGNPCVQFHEDSSLVEKYQPLELFSQGTKEGSPAFGMTLIEEGQYAVDFHAQLSPLQTFSICVAIMHGTSAFSATEEKAKNQQLSQCNSPNTLIEEEVEHFVKSVKIEESRTMSNIPKGICRPCVLKPPFSPIGRV